MTGINDPDMPENLRLLAELCQRVIDGKYELWDIAKIKRLRLDLEMPRDLRRLADDIENVRVRQERLMKRWTQEAERK